MKKRERVYPLEFPWDKLLPFVLPFSHPRPPSPLTAERGGNGLYNLYDVVGKGGSAFGLPGFTCLDINYVGDSRGIKTSELHVWTVG